MVNKYASVLDAAVAVRVGKARCLAEKIDDVVKAVEVLEAATKEARFSNV